MADTRMEVLLRMPFLTLSSENIWFVELLVWKIIYFFTISKSEVQFR